ncbi:hypothetical protein O3M35_010836 [Rhynocoris fuscipes]|uniref:Uncharacterized protein n=1 Tax=Rhynocoris fuscipes TaxID=488301 RepID=A0AAW1D454_9HEMI
MYYDSMACDGSGVCGEGRSCCGAKIEAELKKSATMALHKFLQNNFVSVRAMLASTASALHGATYPENVHCPFCYKKAFVEFKKELPKNFFQYD